MMDAPILCVVSASCSAMLGAFRYSDCPACLTAVMLNSRTPECWVGMTVPSRMLVCNARCWRGSKLSPCSGRAATCRCARTGVPGYRTPCWYG